MPKHPAGKRSINATFNPYDPEMSPRRLVNFIKMRAGPGGLVGICDVITPLPMLQTLANKFCDPIAKRDQGLSQGQLDVPSSSRLKQVLRPRKKEGKQQIKSVGRRPPSIDPPSVVVENKLVASLPLSSELSSLCDEDGHNPSSSTRSLVVKATCQPSCKLSSLTNGVDRNNLPISSDLLPLGEEDKDGTSSSVMRVVTKETFQHSHLPASSTKGIGRRKRAGDAEPAKTVRWADKNGQPGSESSQGGGTSKKRRQSQSVEDLSGGGVHKPKATKRLRLLPQSSSTEVDGKKKGTCDVQADQMERQGMPGSSGLGGMVNARRDSQSAMDSSRLHQSTSDQHFISGYQSTASQKSTATQYSTANLQSSSNNEEGDASLESVVQVEGFLLSPTGFLVSDANPIQPVADLIHFQPNDYLTKPNKKLHKHPPLLELESAPKVETLRGKKAKCKVQKSKIDIAREVHLSNPFVTAELRVCQQASARERRLKHDIALDLPVVQAMDSVMRGRVNVVGEVTVKSMEKTKEGQHQGRLDETHSSLGGDLFLEHLIKTGSIPQPSTSLPTHGPSRSELLIPLQPQPLSLEEIRSGSLHSVQSARDLVIPLETNNAGEVLQENFSHSQGPVSETHEPRGEFGSLFVHCSRSPQAGFDPFADIYKYCRENGWPIPISRIESLEPSPPSSEPVGTAATFDLDDFIMSPSPSQLEREEFGESSPLQFPSKDNDSSEMCFTDDVKPSPSSSEREGSVDMMDFEESTPSLSASISEGSVHMILGVETPSEINESIANRFVIFISLFVIGPLHSNTDTTLAYYHEITRGFSWTLGPRRDLPMMPPESPPASNGNTEHVPPEIAAVENGRRHPTRSASLPTINTVPMEIDFPPYSGRSASVPIEANIVPMEVVSLLQPLASPPSSHGKTEHVPAGITTVENARRHPTRSASIPTINTVPMEIDFPSNSGWSASVPIEANVVPMEVDSPFC
ncbi:hypothetical protein PSTG_13705 [Puccinia striiformis f. sp. tritici PST-78]|uniref:Uncharacterized protein n=1 Tax=Puccinia striiformis f. sp. tritici PST-78 TaxID=1165861 RepID=A0A0L0V129_9BASI|nr:hypothetical protein PSTG_13705 [Puccinia striiformis f. sp. tritici PST-78]